MDKCALESNDWRWNRMYSLNMGNSGGEARGPLQCPSGAMGGAERSDLRR